MKKYHIFLKDSVLLTLVAKEIAYKKGMYTQNGRTWKMSFTTFTLLSRVRPILTNSSTKLLSAK